MVELCDAFAQNKNSWFLFGAMLILFVLQQYKSV
jgi:hypothetical protein